jgi:signal transduction histidine kinase/putative methionine-R-sulfoxide reductase with GAF domain
MREATEREAAISEILRAISRSPTDVQPVLDAIAKDAVRYCAAEDALINLLNDDGTLLMHQASHGPLGAHRPLPTDRTTLTGRAVAEKRTIHVADMQAETAEYPLGSRIAAELGFHTAVATPLLRDEVPFGAIMLRRVSVQPFTEQQLTLLRTFAAQAVIAIENVRLFNETQEALDRQTATAEVLQVISRSAFDLQRVLDTVIESAVRLCGGSGGIIWRRDGEVYRYAAGTAPSRRRSAPTVLRPGVDDLVVTRAALAKRPVQVADVRADEGYAHSGAGLVGPRTRLAIPLLREGVPIGVLAVTRLDVRPFTEDEIRLLTTFADQAVIAIENVRLFNETKEALARQTATSEVLQSISRTVFDLNAVLTTVLENAMRLCDSSFAGLYRREGDVFSIAVIRGGSADWERTVREHPPDIHGGGVTARVTLQKRPVHIHDVLADPDYQYKDSATSGGIRTLLGVPLVRDDEVVGVLSLARAEVRDYSASEIDLVRTFADQAAIAIENVRLFNETKEALERQTAMAEVLKTMSRSAFDLEPVLDTVVENIARLAGGDVAWLARAIGDEGYRVLSRFGPVFERPEVAAVWSQLTIMRIPASGSLMGRLLRERRVIHIEDARADPELWGASGLIKATGAQTVLAIPMLRESVLLGGVVVGRTAVRPFTEREIALVQTFADQAAIAIENVRLFNEIQDKSQQLEAASRHKSEFMANMSHELRTPLNAIIGFSDVLEQRLFGELNDRQADYTRDIASSGRHLLELVNEILDLSKVEAGRMELEHSEFSLADTIHGALAFIRERAASHRIALTADVPTDLGTVVADERKVRQVLLNLLSNAVKFTPDGGTIAVRAWRTNGEVQVAVRDTGIGIAPEDHAKVFDEFQQVGRPSDRSREGTGLGLTLAKRFVELHGGRIWVESEIGKGTKFTFAIPVATSAAAPG